MKYFLHEKSRFTSQKICIFEMFLFVFSKINTYCDRYDIIFCYLKKENLKKNWQK